MDVAGMAEERVENGREKKKKRRSTCVILICSDAKEQAAGPYGASASAGKPAEAGKRLAINGGGGQAPAVLFNGLAACHSAFSTGPPAHLAVCPASIAKAA